MSRRSCCCTKGRAWGRLATTKEEEQEATDCDPCPAPGTPEFEKLCPLGLGRGGSGEDLNECEMMADLCHGGDCINTDGSFRCSCPRGFVLDGSGTRCVDVDECTANARVCGNGTCTNVEGGFECSCSRGYAPGSKGKQSLNQISYNLV